MIGQSASGSASDTGGFTASWLRTRAYPPAGVMPSVSLGSVTSSYVSPTISISPPSNAAADEGQYESFNGVISGGTSPFNVFLNVANAVTTGTVVYTTNAVFAGPSWSFNSILIPANWVTNSPLVANAVVTDSRPTTVSSAYTANFVVNNALADTWTVSNSLIDIGQTQTLTSNTLGMGTAPYTYNFLVYNSTGSLVANALYSGAFATSNTFTYVQNSAWGTGSFTANLIVTDSASSPETTTNTLTYSANAINSASSSSNSGSGSGPSNRTVLITDNINATASSSAPMLNITVSGAMRSYYQNEFPIRLTTAAPSINISFACNAQIGPDKYSFRNDIFGIGDGVSCAKWYTTYTGSIEGIYVLNNTVAHISKANNSTSATTTNATKSGVTSSIPKASITRISNTEVMICSTSSNLTHTLAYGSQGASFRLIQSGSGCYNFTSVNVTNQKIADISLQNKTEILALNITSGSSNVLITATMDYPCDLPKGSVAPYLLKNPAWVPITPFTVNAALCTITFNVPQDPVVAIMENALQSTKNATVSNVSNLPSTTSIPNATPSKTYSNNPEEVAIPIIVIIILIGAYLAIRHYRQRKGFR